jgi:pimeloyl-[acyl-carrier protein] methyl ester esterase
MPLDDVNTVVLLPGMDGSGELFARFVRELDPDIHAVVVRYPADRPLGYAALAHQIRDALPMDRPYVLLAESFAGPIGIEWAARAPKELKGLVLCCTFARCPRPAMRPLARRVPAAVLAALPVAVLGRVLMGRQFEPALLADLKAAMSQLPAGVPHARMRAVLDEDAASRWREVRVPTLYLRAMQDWVVPRSAGDLLLKLRPDTQLVEFSAPHFLLQTRPVEAAAAVTRFIRRLNSGPTIC